MAVTNITQGYNAIPSTSYINYALNGRNPLKEFICFNTEQYQTVVVVGEYDYNNNVFKEADVFTIDRSSSYNSSVTVDKEHYEEVSVSLDNDYYSYSNIGKGQYLEHPTTGHYILIALIVVSVFTVLKLTFGGVLRLGKHAK